MPVTRSLWGGEAATLDCDICREDVGGQLLCFWRGQPAVPVVRQLGEGQELQRADWCGREEESVYRAIARLPGSC